MQCVQSNSGHPNPQMKVMQAGSFCTCPRSPLKTQAGGAAQVWDFCGDSEYILLLFKKKKNKVELYVQIKELHV